MTFEVLKTAYHEGGHAVACVVLNIPFRYVTLRPRSKELLGHVVSRRRFCRMHDEDWQAEAVVNASGIIAEDLYLLGGVSSEHSRQWRKELVRYSGRDDLKALRHSVRINYRIVREDPEWAPESPVEFAKRAWKRSILLVSTHWNAVSSVAHTLCYEKPTLTCADIKKISASTEVFAEDEVKERLRAQRDWEPWFLEHSRLKWEPSPRWYQEIDEDIEWWRANS